MENIDFPFPPVEDQGFPVEGPEFGPEVEELFLDPIQPVNMVEALTEALSCCVFLRSFSACPVLSPRIQ